MQAGNLQVMLSHRRDHLWERSRSENDKKTLNLFMIIEAAASRGLAYV